MLRIARYKKIILGLFLLLSSTFSFASEEKEGAWIGINSQKILTPDEKWQGYLFSQIRFLNEDYPLRVGLIEGGLGYQFVPEKTLWVGYRWSGHNPDNGFYQINRLFQQFNWKFKYPEKQRLMTWRSRLEELQPSDQNQLGVRLRERLTLELQYAYFNHLNPLMYEEIFIPLNETAYSSRHFISENRIFLGFNWKTSKLNGWEIGYINKYNYKTPLQSQNQLENILSVTYFFY